MNIFNIYCFLAKKSAGMAATIPAVRVSGKNFVLFLIHYGKMGTKHPRNSK